MIKQIINSGQILILGPESTPGLYILGSKIVIDLLGFEITDIYRFTQERRKL